LVVATMQLRLTATSLSGLQALEPARHHYAGMAGARAVLDHDMENLEDFYEQVAALVGRPAPHEVALPVSVPALIGLDGSGGRLVTAPLPHLPHVLWVEECLRHLSAHARAVTGPALGMAGQRRLPWWR
jgi:hypothetical protein